jgi:hypothetical protein
MCSGTLNTQAIIKLRDVFFEEFAKSELYGMIFTFMWEMGEESDRRYVERATSSFKEAGAELYYVELHAPQEIRLQRNVTGNRLKHKPSKRDIAVSNARLLGDDANGRFVSYDGELQFENYIKIDNSALAPETVANMIKESFQL